jgi:hypothetical protein
MAWKLLARTCNTGKPPREETETPTKTRRNRKIARIGELNAPSPRHARMHNQAHRHQWLQRCLARPLAVLRAKEILGAECVRDSQFRNTAARFTSTAAAAAAADVIDIARAAALKVGARPHAARPAFVQRRNVLLVGHPHETEDGGARRALVHEALDARCGDLAAR